MYRPTYEEVITTTNTPAYVFDLDALRARIACIKDILGNQIDLCYAMKANPFVVEHIKESVDSYEVCSPGEFKICERAQIPMDKIVLSGVYKAQEDIQRVIATYTDKITYTSESLQQFHLIHTCAKDCNTQVRVLLRISTGNQFGMDEAEVCDIIEHRNLYEAVDIIGIQHFSGTQRKNISKYKEELAYVDDLFIKLKKEYGYEAKEFEFGPGFFVEYFKNGKTYDEVAFLTQFKEALDELKFQGHITLELGRFVVATCGSYYTKVVDVKCNAGVHYSIIDGGIHQIVYFGQMMAMKIPQYRQLRQSKEGQETITSTICGALCTTNDSLVKSLPLVSPQIGDILEFQNAGAYSMCEGISLFLSRDLPKVYVYSKKDQLQLMRDTFETNVLNYKTI